MVVVPSSEPVPPKVALLATVVVVLAKLPFNHRAAIVLKFYYRLTNEGERVLDAFVHDWARFRDAVDAVLAQTTDGRLSDEQ